MPRAKVGTLVSYKGDRIYRVYIPSCVRDKVVCTSHVRFDENGLVTESDLIPNNKALIRINTGDLVRSNSNFNVDNKNVI